MACNIRALFTGRDAYWRMNLLNGLVLLMVVLEAINTLVDHRLNAWGINPVSIYPFPAILVAPFLHASFSHVLLNAGPLLVLGWLVSLRGLGKFLAVSLFIMVIGGTGVWLFGREAFHIGSSGLVFGYFGFLVALGLFERHKRSLFISFLVFIFYGGIFIGVLPSGNRVSWETHLFGLIAGIIAAWVWAMPVYGQNRSTSNKG